LLAPQPHIISSTAPYC